MAYGQCSSDLHIASVEINCQCGGIVSVNGCFYSGPGCEIAANFIPCGDGCYVGSAKSCKATPAAAATSTLVPARSFKNWTDCHGSSDLAYLDEWVKTHTSLRGKRDASAQARN
jgi:hypothetical protein